MTIELNTKTALEQAIEDVRQAQLEADFAADDHKRLMVETAEARVRWDNSCEKLDDAKRRLHKEVIRPVIGEPAETIKEEEPTYIRIEEGVDSEWAANGPVAVTDQS